MAQGEKIMTPKRLEILRGFASDPHVKPWILELVQEIDRLTKELAICDEWAGKHLEKAEKAEAEVERLKELNDKFKWQVRDTCKRAEKAEAELAALKKDLAEALHKSDQYGLQLIAERCRHGQGAG